jgi:uncharacterized membrane protein YvlD (DUF360 family)
MSLPVPPIAFLRRVLHADALVSGAVGALMTLAARPLQGLLGLPVELLALAGGALFPYVAYLVWLASRHVVPRAALWVPIVLNLGWALECTWVAWAGRFDLTALGEAFVAANVVTVLLFAALEYLGLRRSFAIVVG